MSTPRICSTLIVPAVLCFAASAWAQDRLEEGKALVEKQCNTCHPLTARVGSGYTEEGWKTVMRMMANHGAQYPAERVSLMMGYLVKTYPVKGRPDAVLVPGSVKVSMKAFQVPTPASRPHDPLAAKDGSLWYTGQMTNVLGRIDPKTGKVKEYPLKTPHSGPHGLAEDRSGNIWYTGNAAGVVGKLNPKTGEVTEYKMPDPAAKDPHTPIFDKRGILWFTLQGANRIGRLDPKTLEIREFDLPNAQARPRRIAITPDDMVWYTDYPRGYIGRLDPKTGQVKEWQSPSGPKSAPYGISAIGHVLWYSESEAGPNTVVRFDPKTEKFQSWAIPGGGNIVRHTDVTRDGNFVLANSLVNQVTLVRIAK